MASIEVVASPSKPGLGDLVRRQLARLSDWLNEEVAGGPVVDPFTTRDWADLPVHHPRATPDGKDAH
jgi:hypothetical protein